MTNLYLAYPMTETTPEENVVIEKFRKEVLQQYAGDSYSIYDPIDEDYKVPAKIIERDKKLLRRTNMLLVCYTRPAAGVDMEMLTAFNLGKPIFLYTTQKSLSPWVRYHVEHEGKIVDNMEALFECVAREETKLKVHDIANPFTRVSNFKVDLDTGRDKEILIQGLFGGRRGYDDLIVANLEIKNGWREDGIFIEEMSDVDKGKQGWLYTTKADSVIFCHTDLKKALVIHIDKLRSRFEEVKDKYRNRIVVKTSERDGRKWTSKGRWVSFSEFCYSQIIW